MSATSYPLERRQQRPAHDSTGVGRSGRRRGSAKKLALTRTPLRGPHRSGVQTAVDGQTALSTGDRPGPGAVTQPRRMQRLVRFVALELGIWAALYGMYLAVRGLTIGSETDAIAHASEVVGLERFVGVFQEGALQAALGGLHDFFSAYYMLGFAPLVAAVVVWLGLRRPEVYRELRTVLLISIGIAVVVYVLFPTAPPRLVPELGIADTVGLTGHDTGSFAGIRFNPYAAVPSMHVGWSLLVALYGLRAVSSLILRVFFFLHPALMAVAVTATGNHYFFDSLAGIAVALVALSFARRSQPLAAAFSTTVRRQKARVYDVAYACVRSSAARRALAITGQEA